MKIHPEDMICPECGEEARGTLEVLHACAEFGDWPEHVCVLDYSGDTDLWWESQKTVYCKDCGRVCLVCHQGHEWYARCVEDDEEFPPETEKSPLCQHSPDR